MNRDDIRDWIERWEGRRSEVYNDSAGHPTIGVGFNLDRDGAREQIEALGLDYDAVRSGTQSLTDAQIDQLLDHDLDSAIDGAREDVSNFDGLPDDKQQVVVDMVFNLGASGFAQFSNTIDAIENNDWDRAADELQDSGWFDQVGSNEDQRGGANVNLMRNGPENDENDQGSGSDSDNQSPTPSPEPDPTPNPDPGPESAPQPDPAPTPDPTPGPTPDPGTDQNADPGGDTEGGGDAGGGGDASSGSDAGGGGDTGGGGDGGGGGNGGGSDGGGDR